MKKRAVVLSFYHHFVQPNGSFRFRRGKRYAEGGHPLGRSTALEAANLENAVGSGYEFGYYDEDREFVYLDETEETTITMRASGSGNGVTVTETKSGDVLLPVQRQRLLLRRPPHRPEHGDMV